MNWTPHAPATRTRRRRLRPARRAALLVAPLALVAAACGGDDDDVTDDVTDETTEITAEETTATTMVEDTMTEATSADTVEDTMTEDTMTEDTSEGTTVGDTTGDTTGSSAPDSEAVDVLTDTLAGEGVDVFLTLLPIVGFDDEITDADQVTVFVPSDEAFTSVAADELAAIVDDPQRVVEVLQAHVVEGLVTAADLEEMSSVQPIAGEAVPVTVDGDTVMVGDATVIKPDIAFDGGIVHIIDDVLLLEEL